MCLCCDSYCWTNFLEWKEVYSRWKFNVIKISYTYTHAFFRKQKKLKKQSAKGGKETQAEKK